MAIIRFDSRSLHMDVIVGVLENYKPNKTIKEAHEKVEELRKETEKFLDENFGDASKTEIEEELEQDDKKKEIWDDYLKNHYEKKVLEIKKLIDEENKAKQAKFTKEE